MANEKDYSGFVDMEEGLARVRGNAALYKRMLGLFLQSEEFAAFETALAENNLQRASEVMHGIKGMSGNLSLSRVFDLSSVLTTRLRDGVVDIDMINEYRSSLETTKKYVEEIMQSPD